MLTQKNSMRFLKNIGWVSFAQIAASLAAFSYTLISARVLGVENYGLFQAAMGIYGLFSAIHLLFYFGAVHCVGKAPEKDRPAVLGALLTIALFFCAVILLFFLFSAGPGSRILRTSGSAAWMACAALIAANTLLTLFYGSFQAEHRFRLFTLSKIVEVTLTLLSGGLFLKLGWGAAGAIGGYACSMGLVSLFFWFRLRLPHWPSPGIRKMLFQESASLFQLAVTLLFLLALEHIPAVWARYALAPAESGHFAALYNLRNTVWPFALSITLTFYSHLLAKDTEAPLLRQALLLTGALAAGFEITSIFAARPLIQILYGPAFLPAAPLLPLYGLSLALQMFAMLLLFHQTGRTALKILPLLLSFGVFAALLSILGHTLPGILIAQIAGAGVCLLGIFVAKIKI